jgi:hypothetical protein
MANLTPKQFVKRLQGSGVLLVRSKQYYFIPTDDLDGYKLPKEFQSGFAGASDDYFQEVGVAPEPQAVSLVYNGINRALGSVFVADGVDQAVSLERAADVGGKFVSKTSGSQQVLFKYSADPEHGKIVVDMVRGGRPSNS